MGIILKLILRAHNETLKTEILWLRKGVSLSLLWTVFTPCNSGDSVVVIVLCLEYEPGDPGFEYREGKGIFLFSKMPTPALGPTQSLLRNRVLSWGKAATHRHLVLSVTVSGASLQLLNIFTPRTVTISLSLLPFHLCRSVRHT